MPSVTNKLIMLNVVMLNVVMLSVVAPFSVLEYLRDDVTFQFLSVE
jgi:hypothetical protein